MKGCLVSILAVNVSLGGLGAQAQTPPPLADIEVEVTEETLNRIVDPYRMGVLNDSGSDPPLCGQVVAPFKQCEVVGTFVCPWGSELGAPGLPDLGTIPIVRCELVGGGSVLVPTAPPVPWRYWVSAWKFRIFDGQMKFGATLHTEVDSVHQVMADEVSAKIEFELDHMRVVVDPFKVTLKWKQCPVIAIDLSEKFSFSIPIEPQQLLVPVPHGSDRVLNAHVVEVDPQYLPGRIVLNVTVGF